MRHSQQLASTSIALAFVGMILLSGCAASGQTGQPNEAASTASTGTPVTPNATPSATATAVSTEFKFATADGPAQNVQIPKLPETAKKFSKEGLIAFAEHWYATLTYLYASGDKTPIMAVSSSDCDFCVRAAEETSKGYKGGNWIVGGQQALYSTSTDFQEYPEAIYRVQSELQETKHTYYNSDGTVARDLPQQSRFLTRMDAKFTGNQWMVQAMWLEGEKPQDLVYMEK